ncbi:MAG: IS21 family transposase [Thermoleophilaceae bacterium]|nr:IS21 family transposase [Thermoleophilaceae bacterium]
MLHVEQWAEIRRMSRVEGLSQRAIQRRTGIHRLTIKRALETDQPPSYGPRRKRPSKLDPYRAEIERLLGQDDELSGVRIREEIEALGYQGGKSILDELLAELRPRYRTPRTFQSTVYRPGELCQFDLCEPRSEIPVGYGQLRKGYLLTAELPFSRAFAATLIFSKRFEDIAYGMNRCLVHLGALPQKLVWDREGAIHAGRARPTEEFAAFCGRLAVGWIILDPGDCQAKGALERTHRFLHGNFEAGRRFANPLDFQDQLDRWAQKINARVHRSTRAVVSERLAEEHERMRALPAELPRSDRRFVIRVPAQPYLRFDRNDYSLDPHLVGRRVEVSAGQSEISAIALDSGELAARHRRVFAGGLTFTDPAHQRALEELRAERKGHHREPEVEIRPLARYDALIPA